MNEPRVCKRCGKPIPIERTVYAVYCSLLCKVLAEDERKKTRLGVERSAREANFTMSLLKALREMFVDIGVQPITHHKRGDGVLVYAMRDVYSYLRNRPEFSTVTPCRIGCLIVELGFDRGRFGGGGIRYYAFNRASFYGIYAQRVARPVARLEKPAITLSPQAKLLVTTYTERVNAVRAVVSRLRVAELDRHIAALEQRLADIHIERRKVGDDVQSHAD